MKLRALTTAFALTTSGRRLQSNSSQRERDPRHGTANGERTSGLCQTVAVAEP